MQYEIIKIAVAKFINLTDKELEIFISLLEFNKIKSREVLLRPGTVCKHSVFVNQGCLRSYATDKNGFEHILSFAPVGWWMADMYSLISQKPGVLTIEAMTDTDLLILSKKNQDKLFVKVPKFERFFRIITENALVASQQRLLDNLSLSAKERYLKFCNTYPGLINLLPQKDVAAYIGVTPEFLSKMKKNMFPKN